MFAGIFAPADYLFCAGQTLAIVDHSALYSIIGTTYGGDGRVSFKLPDLRGRMPMGAGQGPGLEDFYRLGAFGGTEYTALGLQQLPTHNHQAIFEPITKDEKSTPITATATVKAGTTGTATNDPTDAYWGLAPKAGVFNVQPYTDAANANMAADAVEIAVSGGGGGISGGTVTVGNSGSGKSFSNLPPFLTFSFIICVNGTYPPRN